MILLDYIYNMARRNIGEENIRKIQKVSRSYYVTLPISYVRKLGWNSGQEVSVRRGGDGLFVEKAGARKKNKSD